MKRGEQDLTRMDSTSGTKTASDYFGRMVVFSLLMHAIFSTVLVLGHRGRPGAPPVQYIDLKMMEQNAAVTPSPKPVPEQTTRTEEPVISEKITAPDTPIENTQPAPQPAARPDLPPTSFGFGIANGRFGSISDGRTLRDDMREYYLGMLDKFNESWAKSAETGGIRGAAFMVTVSRNGAIVDAKLLESSGNRSYDRHMLQCLQSAGPLSPLPASYESDFFSAPLKFVGPLNLMSPFSG